MNLNLTYLDPPKYGWTAIGGIAEILEPHEAARRGPAEYQKDLLQKWNGGAANNEAASNGASAVKNDVSENADVGEVTKDVTVSGTDAQSAAAKANSSGAAPDVSGKTNASESAELYYTIIDEKKDEIKEAKDEQQEETRSRRKSGKKSKAEDDKQADEKKEDAKEDQDEKKDPPPKQIAIQSTKDDILDIYSYHRGRVGQEPRDAKGELLAPLDPIDTNHDWRPNNSTKLKIQLDFPLDDEGNSEYRFKDTISWDLADPTLNVEEFTANLATDYNLSFKTTMELTESISRQIQEYVLKSTRFYPPIIIKDAYGNDRPDKQFGCADDVLECFGRREDAILNEGRGRRGVTISRRRGEKKKRERKSEGRSRPMGAVKPQRGTIEIVPPHKVPKPNEDNDPYAAEVLRRAKLESQRIASECKQRGDNVLWQSTNEVCHICHNRKPLVLTFHCGGHAYCDYHCATRLSFRVKDYDPSNPEHPIDHCPICTLHCTCSKCKGRLLSVGEKLKSACAQQGCGPEDVDMPNLLSICSAKITSVPKGKVERKSTPHGGSGPGSKRRDSKDKDRKRSRPKVEESFESGDRPAKKMRRQSSSIKPVAKVLKLNPSEFPRELYEGKDTDPSEPGDDERFFVPVGTVIPTDPAPAQQYQDIIPVPMTVAGNIDYCIVCEETEGGDLGELTCCPKCPRSYHGECLKKDRGENEEEEKRCHRCKIDRHLSPEEAAGEAPQLPDIKVAYGDKIDPFDKKLLELIVEIIEKLKVYDFGGIFSFPVNADEVPGYLNVIKGTWLGTPMDYGTVASKIVGGQYPYADVRFKEDMSASEEIILHAICDIEQVHHNCMLFNLKGSSFYRFGQLHSVKWKTFYKKHIAERLSDKVKLNLEEFRNKCKKEQEVQIRIIVGTKPSNKASNAVGFYDPDTKKVVKQYASKAGLARAVAELHAAGYDCEYDIANLNGKTLVDKLTSEGSTGLLFGYRVISMDRLRSGKFAVDGPIVSKKAANHVIYKVDKASGYTLGGFETEEAAYNDWLQARSVGIASVDPSIGQDMASFHQYFVNGAESINGMEWKRAPGAAPAKPAAEKEQTEPMEEETVESQPTLSTNSTMEDD